MRDGWEPTALGRVTRQVVEPVAIDGARPYSNLGVKWYAAGTFLREPKLGSEIKASRLYRVRPGQFVYNRLFATEGSFALVRPEDEGAVASNEFPVFDVDPDRLLPEYLGLHFQQPSVWHEVHLECTGTTKSRLRWKEERFAAHTIVLPRLEEQQRIVDVIGALDDSIDRLGECTAAAMQAHDAVRRYLLAGTPEWSQKRIGEVAQAVTGRAFPARFQGRAAGIYPYIKCSDMNADGQELVMSEAANWIDDSVSDQLGAKILPTGTVIFPILGAALATEKRRVLGLPAAFDQNVMGLVPGPLITSDFLLAVMSETSLARLSQQGAVPSVNQSIVSSIAIPLPSLDEQRRIGGVLAASAEGVRKARQAAAALRAVREHALGSLLSGEHEIPESYDELMGVAS